MRRFGHGGCCLLWDVRRSIGIGPCRCRTPRRFWSRRWCWSTRFRNGRWAHGTCCLRRLYCRRAPNRFRSSSGSSWLGNGQSFGQTCDLRSGRTPRTFGNSRCVTGIGFCSSGLWCKICCVDGDWCNRDHLLLGFRLCRSCCCRRIGTIYSNIGQRRAIRPSRETSVMNLL